MCLSGRRGGGEGPPHGAKLSVGRHVQGPTHQQHKLRTFRDDTGGRRHPEDGLLGSATVRDTLDEGRAVGRPAKARGVRRPSCSAKGAENKHSSHRVRRGWDCPTSTESRIVRWCDCGGLGVALRSRNWTRLNKVRRPRFLQTKKSSGCGIISAVTPSNLNALIVRLLIPVTGDE